MLFTRLLEQSLLRGKISDTDRYGCFPYEIKHGFAPFYMYFLVHATGFFYTLFPGCEFDPVMVAGVLPLLFVWLTGILIIVAVWRLSGNRQLLLFAAFFMLPGLTSAMTGQLLKLDYDFLISFFIWSWLLMCALYSQTRHDYLKIAGGTVVTLFVATWSGTPLFFFLVTAYGFFIWLARREDADDFLVFASSSMLIGSLLNVIYLFNSAAISEPLSLNKYSYFQPLCIIAGGFFLYLLKSLQRCRKPRLMGIALLAVMAAAVGIVFHDQIMQSTGLLMQKDPIHSTISELVAVFSPGKLASSGKTSANLADYFGWTIFLLPFFVLLAPKGFRGSAGVFLRDWLAIMIFLSVYQVRYLRWMGIGSGLYSGLAVFTLWKLAVAELHNSKWRNLRLVLIFLPLFLLFSLQGYVNVASTQSLSEPQVEAFNWIAKNTPPTSGYADDGIPEYSILTYWDEGNLLSYYARRPVAVNNAMWGFKTMADVFSAENEDEAFKLCSDYGVKYIYLSTYRQFDDKSYGFWSYFKPLPRKPEYQLIHQDVPVNLNFKNWFYFWLRDNLALTPKGKFNAGSRFRVVYASKVGQQTLPPYFLFEKVNGARLNINVDPESTVSLSIEMKISEQQFVYKINRKADASGNLSLLLPYATAQHGGRVLTDPFYKLSYNRAGQARKARLIVSDQAVVEGLPLDLKIALEELSE